MGIPEVLRSMSKIAEPMAMIAEPETRQALTLGEGLQETVQLVDGQTSQVRVAQSGFISRRFYPQSQYSRAIALILPIAFVGRKSFPLN